MATKIMTFDEYVISLYDSNKNGKIDKGAETRAWKRALNNKNYDKTRESWQQYVAMMEQANNNERKANAEAEQLKLQQTLIEAAGSGNETAAAVLTGESKGKTAKSFGVIIAVVAVAAFILLRRK